MQDNPSEDEEFRPSSEMIKIWQTMEREIIRSEDKQCREAQRDSRVGDVCRSDTAMVPNKSCDEESRASDLSTITEESTSPSPLKHQTGSLKAFGEEAIVLRAPVPRVAQLKGLLQENIVSFVKNELQKIKKNLSPDDPECLESQREDEEVLDAEDEEQRRSSRESF
ncbi:hypothetical protein GBF38_006493 [Nibea albiflora]|uniref:Uncharacterized protein n=1 Tax=Nibea albiflora TaxID=240163 RepID=A0ACB7FBK5_NIBAL|nr:hypothetical protein GBF38_006493 [Nibea albiflora]